MKDEFLNICRYYIKRDGIEQLLKWLEEETEFFTAPASTKYHGAFTGGLVTHSINVCKRLCELYDGRELKKSDETIAIVSLLHDVCKHDCYKKNYRNRKNESGQWEKVEYYVYNESAFPFGHGEKSVYLISKFIQLTDEEALAIRWHMGAYDKAAKSNGSDLNNAIKHYPLCFYLSVADMEASHFDEAETEVF